MGKWLFIGAIMLLVAGIANFFIQSSALMITLSVLAIGIFSAFILHDLKRVQDGLETNYITATLGVYLSIYNVFSRCCSAGHRRRPRRMSGRVPGQRPPSWGFAGLTEFLPMSCAPTCASLGLLLPRAATPARPLSRRLPEARVHARLMPFVYYRIALGVLVLALLVGTSTRTSAFFHFAVVSLWKLPYFSRSSC